MQLKHKFALEIAQRDHQKELIEIKHKAERAQDREKIALIEAELLR